MEFVLDIATVVVGSAVVAAQIWATRQHFHSETMPVGAAVIGIGVIASWALFSVLMLTGGQPVEFALAGLLVQIASGVLFWQAVAATRAARLRYVFDPKAPHRLITAGPYRLVRHPFYTSYIMLWAGWAFATASPWALPPLLFLTAAYCLAARREEASFAGTPLAAQYKAYRVAAGFMLPRLPGRSQAAGRA
jgi:protein-S-isoprenylcysteine O-methyltransferase Ste14